MAIEYILDTIKATSGQDIEVCAEITDDDGIAITEGCGLMLHGKDGGVFANIAGTFADGIWSFNIPADLTKDMKGRYYYCICSNGQSLCFMKPFYLE